MSDKELIDDLIDKIKCLELDVQYQLHLNEELKKNYEELLEKNQNETNS